MSLVLAELESPVALDAFAWRLFVAITFVLAFVHAYRKLSPYFAVAWFGSALVFGWFWTSQRTSPEAVLLPGFVVYLAAAVTKGVVERGALSGNHLAHVLGAGLFAGLIALPLEAACATQGWVTPRGGPSLLGSALDGPWFGGASADVVLQWSLIGTLFYGIYKLLDHVGLGPVLQTVALFGVMPFLPRGLEAVLSWMGGTPPGGGLG